MNPLFNIKSIRFGSVHIEPWSWEHKNLGSKNKAKAHSRELGGAGKVVAARDAEHLKNLKKEFEAEKLRRDKDLVNMMEEINKEIENV